MITTTQLAPLPTSKTLSFEGMVATFAAAILLLGAVLWSGRPYAVEQRDFSVTYIGARMVYLGLGSKLYDLDEQRKLKASLLPNGEPLIYEHPPFEALLLAPLGALPYRTAYLLWGLINVAIWLSLPWLLRPYAPRPREDLGYIVLWVLFAPLGVALFQGQSSLLVLLLYAAAFTALRQNQDFRAGALLGLALVKFQFVIPFAVIFLLRRKWRFLNGFFATACVLAVLSLLAVGWRGVFGYVHLLATVALHPNNLSYGKAVDMATIQGLAHVLFDGIFGGSIVLVVVAAVSASLIAWIAWAWNRFDATASVPRNDLMFGAAILVSLVTGFHMFTHDLSPMMLAMLLVSAYITQSSERWVRYVLRACLILFWIPPIYFVLLARHRMYLLVPPLLIFLCAMVRLAAGLAPDRSGVQHGLDLTLDSATTLSTKANLA